ncbi:hypothetical protein RQP46_007552 [Phenoliferia psychrophenolica]
MGCNSSSMDATSTSNLVLHINDYELTSASLVALLTQHPNITTLCAPNLSLILDPASPRPSFRLKKLHTLNANVAPSLLHFLSQLPRSSLPKLRRVSLIGSFFKRDFMGLPMDEDYAAMYFASTGIDLMTEPEPEPDYEGYNRTQENVAAFMRVFGPKLNVIEARGLRQITTSDIRNLKRVVPGAESDRSGYFGDDDADWEWRQGAQALVRVR